MAQTGAAQSKLGELFVDIGVGGVGKTLKALNSVSASFLLTKNAAVQITKPFINMGKQALNTAVDVGKLGSTLGITYKEAYKLKYYFKHLNLSEGLVGDIEKMSELFSLMAQGQAQLSGTQATGFRNLGMDWKKYYGGGYEKSIQLFKELQQKTAHMDRTQAATSLQQLNLSTDWLYAFDRSAFDLSDALSVSDETIQKEIAAQEAINDASLALEQAIQNLTVEIAPYVTEYAPKIADAITKYAPTIADGMGEYLPPILTALGNLLKSLGWIIKLGGKIVEFEGMLLGKLGFKISDTFKPDNLKPYEGAKYNPKNFSADITPAAITMPNPSVSNMNNAINITNNITGKDAAEIAQKTTNSTKWVIENMMYNKFQVANVPGK